MATDTVSPASFAHSRDSTLVNSPVVETWQSRNTSTASSRGHIGTMSGPFQYADDLETTSDVLLDFYLYSPDLGRPDPSQQRVAYKPLLRYIEQSDLAPDFRHGISSVITCIVEIGDLLYPPTYLLNEKVTKRVVELATYVTEYTSAVVDHLQARIEKSYEAFCRLPSPCVTDSTEERALSIAAWSAILEHLHVPTDRENYIFGQISIIFSSHVYHPFLQLHRTNPDHNMWKLEASLTPISTLLREAATLAAKVDDSVRAIDEEFELTMSGHSDDSASSHTGVLRERKKHHIPTRSAPVARATAREALRRHRENTL